MARPRKVMDDSDWEKLVNMIRIQCTQEEICGIFGMDHKTLDRIIKERGEDGFSHLYKKHQDEGKASLRRAQWKAAQEGNSTMLVWLGKQALGQRDKSDVDLNGTLKVSGVEMTFVGSNPKAEDR